MYIVTVLKIKTFNIFLVKFKCNSGQEVSDSLRQKYVNNGDEESEV